MDIKLHIKHYRVPRVDRTVNLRKGSPPMLFMRRYGRGVGWLKNDKGYYNAIGDWEDIPPLERGGITVCEVVHEKDGEKRVLGVGEAHCSMSDHFNYHLGFVIASGRAMEAARPELEKQF